MAINHLSSSSPAKARSAVSNKSTIPAKAGKPSANSIRSTAKSQKPQATAVSGSRTTGGRPTTNKTVISARQLPRQSTGRATSKAAATSPSGPTATKAGQTQANSTKPAAETQPSTNPLNPYEKLVSLTKSKQNPPRAYTTAVKETETNSSSQGQAPWTINSDSKFKYKVDSEGRPVLIEETITDSQAGSSLGPRTSKNYTALFYDQNNTSISLFRFFSNQPSPADAFSISNGVIQSYKQSKSAKEIYEEVAFLGQPPNSTNTGITPQGATLTRIKEREVTQFTTSANGGGTTIAPTTLRTSKLQFDTKNPETYKIGIDESPGEQISGIGKLEYNNSGLSITGSASGDTARPRSTDKTYLQEAQTKSTLESFGGSYNSWLQWIPNDILIYCLPLPQEFRWQALSGSITDDISGFRVKGFEQNEVRSNGDFSKTLLNMETDPVTGLYKNGQSELNSSYTDNNGLTQTQSQKIFYEIETSQKLESPSMLSTEESDPILAAVKNFLSGAKTAGETYTINGWSDNNKFLFSSII